jgi:DNA-binding SARP family transcriptional activator/class 3 adenylate cyclase
MRFRMLGPLEVVDGDQPVPLGGIKQRATLGFLLLHANRVVAASQLLKALWVVDDAPTSARKILQNAVWGLRGVLPSNGSAAGSAVLLSQAPGYMLRVEHDQVDLYCFQRLVKEGRAELATGSPEAATLLLRDALALWQGPVLADLVETGINWPELTSVENARLDVMEDYFEAELACGRHHEVLGELEMMLDTEAPRERSCSQLMLALYRCGRQTDALNVYGRVRSALVDNLGLEPGRKLQELQHSILTHDPTLISAEVRQHAELRITGARNDRVDEVVRGAESGLADAVAAETQGRLGSDGKWPNGTSDESPVIPLPRTVATERKDVSVLIAQTQLVPEFNDVDPEEIDEILESVVATIRDEAERFGGTVTASMGSVSLALFGVPRNREDHAERAVRAALMIRDRLSTSAGPAARITPTVRGVSIHVAVATGEALVRYQPDDSGVSPSVNGALLNECHSLLSLVPAGEIRICDNTRRATESAITSHSVGDSSGSWQVGGARQECIAQHAVPVIDRECELEVLHGLLQRARHRATPQLVTVLGEPGIGKTRFIMEFERRVAVHPEVTRFLVGRIPPFAEDNPLAVLTEILSSYCGIPQGGSAKTARAKLTKTIQRLVHSEEERSWLLTCLSPLIDPAGCTSQVSMSETLEAWRQFLEEIAVDRPLVVIIDDLHCADDVLVDFVEHLAESSRSVPLLVIATARPELLKRRSEWGGGLRRCATITLEPISDTAIDRLLEFLLSTMDSELKDLASGLFGATLANIGEEPDVRRSYVRKLLASGSSPSRRNLS